MTKSEINETKIISQINLTEDERKLILLIQKEPSITQKKIHDKTQIPLGTIKRLLPKLQKNGIIKRIGNNRSGKWIITVDFNDL